MEADKELPQTFKEQIIILLNDYIEIKKNATELGYDSNALKLIDYINAYIKFKNSKIE